MVKDKIVVLKNIYKKYRDSESPVLKEINLEIYTGKLTFICGPSGVGKSTLLHIIGLIDVPTSGEVYFFDEKINFYNSDTLSKLRINNIGFMFQHHYLLENLTVKENILLPYWIKNKSVKNDNHSYLDYINFLGIENFLSRYPYELSGGEQQRVALARALVNQPKLLIADEPTGNLDYTNALNLVQLIKKCVENYNMTVIVATHNLALTEYGDVIINLQDGIVKEIIIKKQ